MYNPPPNEVGFLNGLGRTSGYPRSKVHVNRPTLTQTLLKMRTSNRILTTFTEDPKISHSLTRKQLDKSPKLKFKSPNQIDEIINRKIIDVTTAENIDISKTSCSSSDSCVASSTSSLVDIQEAEKSLKVCVPVELPIKRNIVEKYKTPVVPLPVVPEEESFRAWALSEREKRNQILQQASFQQSRQEREQNEVFPRVKQKRRKVVSKFQTKEAFPGYLYGPYTKALEFDHAMKRQTKFGVPLSMFTRAKAEAKIKNEFRRKLQISRLEYMKIPTIPSDSETDDDDPMEFTKHISLVKTPFASLVPKITTTQVRRTERLRTKFLKGNRVKRISFLLYDRTVPYLKSDDGETLRSDGSKSNSRASKSGSATSRRGSVASRRGSLISRRGSDQMSNEERLQESEEEEGEDTFEDLSPYRRKYREFLNSIFKEKLQQYNDKLNQRLISFEKFRESERTSSTTTAKPSILDRKSFREFSTETTSINVSISTPDPSFKKVQRTVKKNVRLSGFDNETGPFYIDPFLLEKNHNPEKG